MPSRTIRIVGLALLTLAGLSTARSARANPDVSAQFLRNYSASDTDFAQHPTHSIIVPLGFFRAGTTIRVGTCNGGGDLPSATFTGDTYLRLIDDNGGQLTESDDTSGCGLGSYVVYTVPYSQNLTLKAGCYSSGSCSGSLYYRADLDSTGSLIDVGSAFGALGNWTRTVKNWYYRGLEVPGSYTKGPFFNTEPHFQGVQRIRSLNQSAYTASWFAITGSGNADLFFVTMSPTDVGPSGVLADFTGPADITHSAARIRQSFPQSWGGGTATHMGGFQSYGKYIAMGLEKLDDDNKGHILFLDTDSLFQMFNPGASLMYTFTDRETGANGNANFTGSTAAVAVNKAPGASQPFWMAVAGAGSKSIDFYRLNTNPQGYASARSSGWEHKCRITEANNSPFEEFFQSLALVPQDNGQLFLIGTRSDSGDPQGSGNRARLYRLDPDGAGCFKMVDSGLDNFGSYDSTGAGFNGSAGVYIDPEASTLFIYSMHAWRPNSDPGTTPFVEFRQ
jgi:hypothetical protein